MKPVTLVGGPYNGETVQAIDCRPGAIVLVPDITGQPSVYRIWPEHGDGSYSAFHEQTNFNPLAHEQTK